MVEQKNVEGRDHVRSEAGAGGRPSLGGQTIDRRSVIRMAIMAAPMVLLLTARGAHAQGSAVSGGPSAAPLPQGQEGEGTGPSPQKATLGARGARGAATGG